MESGALEKVIEISHKLDPFFMTEKVVFVSNSGEPLEREFPRVTDLNAFLQYIHEVKGLCFHDTELKLGVDGGGGFLKFCLLTMDLDELAKGWNSLETGILTTILAWFCQITFHFRI